jgi:hypothetical protein
MIILILYNFFFGKKKNKGLNEKNADTYVDLESGNINNYFDNQNNDKINTKINNYKINNYLDIKNHDNKYYYAKKYNNNIFKKTSDVTQTKLIDDYEYGFYDTDFY